MEQVTELWAKNTISATIGCDLVSAWHGGMSEELPTSSVGCDLQRPSASPQRRSNPLPGQTDTWTQSQKLWHTDKSPCHTPTHARTVDVSSRLYPLSWTGTVRSHAHGGSYLRAKSNYGFQIPLHKSSPVCVTTGYICAFLIQDKSSSSLRCILSLDERWLNRCVVLYTTVLLCRFL